MGVRDHFAKEFALAVAGVSSDPIAHVERYVEATTAPAAGAERTLLRGPVVEGNLILSDKVTGAEYRRGIHYVETALGFDNLGIPAGTALEADYFYRPGEPADEGAPGLKGSATRTASPRFATLLKMGV